MEILALKCLAIGVLFVLGFIGGVIPICCIRPDGDEFGNGVGRSKTTKRIISLLNSAAAGIFLSVALVHLLPDVRLIFETALNITAQAKSDSEMTGKMEFDWAGFTAGIGFLLVVLVEQLMMSCLERSEARNNHRIATDESILVKKSEIDNGTNSDTDYGTLRERSPSQCQSDVSEAASYASTTILRGLDNIQPITSFRALVLLVSLSLHGIFEGLALGLQLESRDTVDLLIAISAHKAVESFTVLLRFAQIPGRAMLKWTSLIVFSLTSPIGIAIGIPLADPSVNADALLVNGILQGLATGTFMFVTFVELLPAELEGKDDRMLKFFCLLVGFGLMCGLTQI